MKHHWGFALALALAACGGSTPRPSTPEVEIPEDEATLRDEGERALAEGRLDEAKRLLERALRDDPRDPRAKLHLALAYDLSGDGAHAERLLRELVEAEPNMARAWSNLGSVLLDRQADEEALSAFERALEIEPQLAEAHFGRGLVLEARGDARAAASAYREAVRLDPKNPLPRLRLGLALVDAPEEAIAELRRAVSLAGDQKAILAVAAGALLRLGKSEDAAMAFERARELGDTPSLAGEHVLALVAGKAYGRAAVVADEALRAYPGDLALRYLRGVIHLRVGEKAAAKAIFTELATQRDDPAIAERARRGLAESR